MWFYGGAFIMVSTDTPTAARAGGVSLNEGRAVQGRAGKRESFP
jgi:hypothetical protein